MNTMRKRLVSYVIFVVAACLVLVLFGGAVLAQTQEPRQILETTQADTVESATPTVQVPVDEPPPPTATKPFSGVVSTRTPVPTATPGRLARQVSSVVAATGLENTSILGLTVTDWVNLGISVLFVLAAYALGSWLIRSLLPRLVRRTPTAFDEKVLEAIGLNLRWLLVILTLFVATNRLTFLRAAPKVVLRDVYFVLGLWVVFRIIASLLNLAERWYRDRLVRDERSELDPILTLYVRVGRVVAAVVAISFLLHHFGVNIVAFGAALGVVGLTLSLAARDTISDAIAGFVILGDQPFRTGDRIEIQGVGTWGDVAEIGLRTTKIRTRDNRMVIVPNSIIGSSQVINYTYPDPRYRIQINLGLNYGTDIELAQQIIVDTVRQVEGALPDKPVDVLYSEMGDETMDFRVRWWIDSYADTLRVTDQVLRALQAALDEAGIQSPDPAQDINLHVGPETANRLLEAFGGQDRSDRPSGG